MPLRLVTLCLLILLYTSATAGTPVAELVIQNQQFTVKELPLPADTKIKLVIHNQGSLPAEFESYDLSREVVVPGHSAVTVFIGPLSPGRYNFFNDFNHAAQGWVVVAAPPSKPGH
jgi:Cupredoxin-like domain